MTFRIFSTLIFLLSSTSCQLNPESTFRERIYIDDFEECKLSDPVGIKSTGWFRASPPVLPDSLWYYPPAWDFYWFSPISADLNHRIRRDDIIELSEAEKKSTMTANLYLDVLRLHASMAPRSDSLVVRLTKAWAGIMYPITPNAADKTLMRYFEFFVKADQGFQSGGTLKLQMGTMREDISLNGGPPNGTNSDLFPNSRCG